MDGSPLFSTYLGRWGGCGRGKKKKDRKYETIERKEETIEQKKYVLCWMTYLFNDLFIWKEYCNEV